MDNFLFCAISQKNMICRLCLENFNEFLPIESEIAKTIAKYFHIEVQLENAVSNKICVGCFGHLDDFHQFWLSIERKQETLRDYDIKCDLSSLLVPEDGKATEKWEPVDVKADITLSEPEIVLQEEAEETSSPDAQEFAEALADDDFSSAADDTDVDVAVTRKSKPTNTKRTKSKAKPLADEVLSDDSDSDDDFLPNAKPTKRKYTKSKAKATKVTRAKRINQRAEGSVKPPKKVKVPVAAKSTTTSRRPDLLAISREMDAFISSKVPELGCCMCNERLPDFNALKKHFRKAHKCVGYVRCCKNRFKKRALYVDHLKWHDNPDFFKCAECQKRLRTRNCYENHMATVHPPADKLNFQCEFCSRKFARQYILDYHLKSHRDVEKTHICELCQKGFRSTGELELHHQRVHLNMFATMCDICGKHFKSKANLDYHMEYVHKDNVGRTEVQCELCQKWLRDARSMSKHMFRHREEASDKQFVCGECGAVKKTRTILAGHIRYHHPKEIFKCTLCEKDFKRQLALDEHMATHTGIALYTCQFCTRTFKSHANMHNHKKKMHPTEWVRKYSQPTQQAASASSTSVSSEIGQSALPSVANEIGQSAPPAVI